ncbi:GNAT family N-acetyltransferase [Thermohalobacter berrensis]|uniref:GNAT family N-acetyltransferase n=1 Tax=Thermohalobacter berrensis TaxID=99594 RepID=A0A419TA83_9FIRM|nr:GNAT family protein [Thermohalobacter berrensis]RKD34382.1 GNAT family N-acetyltransferase [Thermohalobacter berrensis]
MKLIFNNMKKEEAKEISNWKYEEPYSIYSLDGSEETIAEFMNGSYYFVYENNKLIGYFCFGESAQIPVGKKYGVYDNENYIDIGLGLKPEMCGKGEGYNFVKAGLDYAKSIFIKNKFRLTVASFNKRAIKVYKKVGFEEIDYFTRKNKKGNINFIVMILDN